MNTKHIAKLIRNELDQFDEVIADQVSVKAAERIEKYIYQKIERDRKRAVKEFGYVPRFIERFPL